MAKDAAAFRIGDRLNQYELLRVLGQGGHAVVFHGRDEASNRDVAIKVIQNPKHDLKLRARAEGDLLISLRHPHVVEVYDAGVAADGSVYIVMEKLEGRSLREIIQRLRKLTVLEALPIAIQVASGVLAAHARKVVHRDLKPDNIFVQPDGTVKVLDFGIAKYVERSFDTTQKRMWQGTPSYMAPEQFQGLPVSYRSDVFALGVILYELVGGIKPSHIGGDPTSVEQFAIRQLAVDPPMLHKLDSSIPTSVSRMIRRAIAKSPEDRFDMDELLRKMQAELAAERKRSASAAPRDLVRACLDVTDPDFVPAFTALSQQKTRSVNSTSTSDSTLPGLGPDDAEASFLESQPRLITERLAEPEAAPTHTAAPLGDISGPRTSGPRTDIEPVLSSKIFDAPRPRGALREALLLGGGGLSLGLLLMGAFAFRPGSEGARVVAPSAHSQRPPAATSPATKTDAAVSSGDAVGEQRVSRDDASNAAVSSGDAAGARTVPSGDAIAAGAVSSSTTMSSTRGPAGERPSLTTPPRSHVAVLGSSSLKPGASARGLSERSAVPRAESSGSRSDVAVLSVGSGLAGEPLQGKPRSAASPPLRAARGQSERSAATGGASGTESRRGKLWFPPK